MSNQCWVLKVGPVSGNIYMYGFMTVSSTYHFKFVRLDSSDNVLYTTAYAGYINIRA